MPAIVGIDLGTTHSLIAVPQDGQPRLIPNSLGSTLTPSVVAVDENGEIMVGGVAKEYQVLFPGAAASGFKRQMGSDWKCQLGKHAFNAAELSSLVLKSLKQDAESHLQAAVDRAVITVPAYFNNEQRQATIDAGKLAGFTVERIINEPTAAALAYGVHESDSEKTIAVFDLGGGTFDISVVDFFEGAIEVRASAGESILGGEDFTRALARAILANRSIMFEHAEIKTPALVSRLLQQCEKAKRTLSTENSASIFIPDAKGNLDTQAEPVTIMRDLLTQSCESLMQRIAVPVRRAMGDARLSRQDLDQVILVGGATRMPMIIEAATQMFGAAPSGCLNPDEVVVLGAAFQAGLIDNHAALDDVVVVDVAPFTLGVEISKQLGTEYRSGYFLPIINRNTVIPTSRSHTVATVVPNQEVVTVNVSQGESRMTADNLLLGQLEVARIPRGPAGQEVEIRFTYDSNGVLEVETTVVSTGQKSHLVITKHAKNLGKREIEAAIRAMEKLKIHPRETTFNRFVLKRSQRLYQELPSFLRDELGMLLDAFEMALDSQNPGEIDMFREHLELFLSSHDANE